MLNIFKTKIPKEKAQEVTEIESHTVEWEYKTGWGNNTNVKHKVFLNKSEGEEFKKQLEECAKFIGCWIGTRIYRN